MLSYEFSRLAGSIKLSISRSKRFVNLPITAQREWRRESRTKDNQDSKDHFCGPLNKRNDTKISCILSCFLECFVGSISS